MTDAAGKRISLPRSFRLIHLERAREPGHPDGDRRHGYTVVAPLTADYRIDLEEWKKHKEACRVVKMRPGEPNEVGHLVHRRGTWAFHYDVSGDDDDESGYRFAHEKFEIGEYVSVNEDEGLHTYRITSVEHL